MCQKVIILITLVLVGVSLAQNEPSNGAAATKTFLPEDGCSSQGGICVLESDCSLEDTYLEGGNLCPNQASGGAVCCSKLPSSYASCSLRGGECVSAEECPNKRFRDGLGQCQTKEHVCCIFV